MAEGSKKQRIRRQRYVLDSEGNLCIPATTYLRQTFNCSPRRAKIIAEEMAAQGIIRFDESVKYKYLVRVNNSEIEAEIEEFMESYEGSLKGAQKNRTLDSLHNMAEKRKDFEWIDKMNKGKLIRGPRTIRIPCLLSNNGRNSSKISDIGGEIYMVGDIREELKTLTLDEISFRDFLGYLSMDQYMLADNADPHRNGDSILGRLVFGKNKEGEKAIGYEKKRAIQFIDFVKKDFERRQISG